MKEKNQSDSSFQLALVSKYRRCFLKSHPKKRSLTGPAARWRHQISTHRYESSHSPTHSAGIFSSRRRKKTNGHGKMSQDAARPTNKHYATRAIEDTPQQRSGHVASRNNCPSSDSGSDSDFRRRTNQHTISKAPHLTKWAQQDLEATQEDIAIITTPIRRRRQRDHRLIIPVRTTREVYGSDDDKDDEYMEDDEYQPPKRRRAQRDPQIPQRPMQAIVTPTKYPGNNTDEDNLARRMNNMVRRIRLPESARGGGLVGLKHHTREQSPLPAENNSLQDIILLMDFLFGSTAFSRYDILWDHDKTRKGRKLRGFLRNLVKKKKKSDLEKLAVGWHEHQKNWVPSTKPFLVALIQVMEDYYQRECP